MGNNKAAVNRNLSLTDIQVPEHTHIEPKSLLLNILDKFEIPTVKWGNIITFLTFNKFFLNNSWRWPHVFNFLELSKFGV